MSASRWSQGRRRQGLCRGVGCHRQWCRLSETDERPRRGRPALADCSRLRPQALNRRVGNTQVLDVKVLPADRGAALSAPRCQGTMTELPLECLAWVFVFVVGVSVWVLVLL